MTRIVWPTATACLLKSATDRQPAELGSQVGVFGALRRLGSLDQCRAQPATPFAGPATVAFAGTPMIARAHACPGRQVSRAAKAFHVDTNLGDVLMALD
jgi:hypothetical protein